MSESIPILSRNLASVRYDLENHWLDVTFRNGAVYRYFTVPEPVYQRLLTALSPGVFFHVNIRLGGYPFQVLKARPQ